MNMEKTPENTSSTQGVSIPERILKREQERILAQEKRQEEREDKEGYGFSKTFNDNFNKIKDVISDMDENGEKVNKDELRMNFADINKQILLLNHIIVDAKIYLTSYEMKTCSNKLTELTEHCNTLEAKLLPRKKFGFRKLEKSKPKEQGDKIEQSESKDNVDFVKSTPQHEGEKDIGFYNRSNETLILPNEEIHRKPVSLSNIDACVVKVDGNASTIHMNNIRRSKIYLGPVSNSVFIENCSNSTLHLACHQLRMHTSDNCKVYLHVGSRPIIEHCKGIGFAPAFHIDKDLFQESGLDDGKNHWDEVDDFNWLSEEKSPNWFVIEEADRESQVKIQ